MDSTLRNNVPQQGFEITIEGIFGRKRKVSQKYHTYLYSAPGTEFDPVAAAKAVADFAARVAAKPGKCAYKVCLTDHTVSDYLDQDGKVVTLTSTMIRIGRPSPVLLTGTL